MALESLKNKLSSLPGSQGPSSNAPATPMPRLSLSSPISSPSMQMANSTPALPVPGTSTIDVIKKGLKILNPLQPTEVRPLFARADQREKLAFGGPVIGFTHDLVARTIEAIPAAILTTVANFRLIGSTAGGSSDPGRVNLPFDASRLGITDKVGQKFIEDSGSKMIRKFDELETLNPGSKTNIPLAALSPVMDVLDAVSTGEILQSVARQGLNATNYSPELNKALQQYGIQGMKGEKLTTEFVKRFNKKARALIKAEDMAGLDELGRATNVIVTNMTGKGIPQLNRFGQMIQDISRLGLQDAKYGFKLKNPMFAELAPDAPRMGLPGYVWDEARPKVGEMELSIGMSTRRVRRVGGEDAQGPYFRSAEGGKKFDPVDEKNVMPAPIRQDLDTFVTKTDEGFAVIEGKTGQQLGETEKTMAAAISSAKKVIEEMPEGQLDKLIDESPLSPRYQQVEEEPMQKALSLEAPKVQPKPSMTPDSPEKAAIEYYDAKIRPQVAEGKSFVVGADDLKDYFGNDYNDANHPIYSKASFQLYEKALKESDNSKVIFTGGGPGAGKTEMLVKPLADQGDSIIYDSNMSNLEGAKKQIQMARDAGKKVEVWGILPDLEAARRHTILRENATGRGISTKTFGRGHAGFPNVLKELLDSGSLSKDEVHLFDTRGITDYKEAFKKVFLGIDEKDPVATLNRLRYTEEDLSDIYGKERFNQKTGERISKPRVREGSSEVPAQNRPDQKATERSGDGSGVEKAPEGRKEVASRPNRKLEERVAQARSFEDFYNKSGVTMASLDATAQRKGFANAKEFYDAKKAASVPPKKDPLYDPEEESLQLMADREGQSDFALRAAAREEAQITDNLTSIFAAMKGVDLGDLKNPLSEDALEQMRMHYGFASEGLVDHPGRALLKFVSKKEGQFLDPKNPKLIKNPAERARVEERNAKLMRAAESAFEGTKWSDTYDDPDVIREAIEDYIEKRDELRAIQEEISRINRSVRLAKQMGNFVDKNKKKLADKLIKQQGALSDLVAAAQRSGYRKGLKEGSKKYDILVSNLRERRRKLAALQEAYNLTDAEFKKMRGVKDPRFMTAPEFDNYVAGIETGIQKFVQRRQERIIIDALIKENDLKKVDNLRKAMQFPKMENMSYAQLVEFGDILSKTAPGDTFLGPRMIQTAKNTELGDIKTMAEGRKAIAEKLGIDPKTVGETADGDVFMDKFLRDPAWANKDPLRKTIVTDWVAADIQRVNKQQLLDDEIEKLAKASRESRRKAGGVLGTFREKLLSRFAKTDDLVAQYMETLPSGLTALEKRMTPAEIEFGKFGRELMQKYYQYSVDDAAQRWTLGGVRNTRFKDMYLPHMGPKFFERWQGNGFVDAVKGMFKTVQDTKVDFNAFGDRGEVLGFEKFFKNAQKRENLEATEYSKNVAAVLKSYVNAFERKIQLDGQIPKIKLLEQLLGRKYRTPKTIDNPDGAEKVSSNLTRTLNEWINNKKGQKIEFAGVQQGSQPEKFLQVTNMLISLLDLGGNMITQTASGVGGEVFNVLSYARGGTGAKGWVKGHARAMTKQGRKIARQNPGVIEVAPWNTLANSFNDAGQTLMSSLFYVFADLSYRARRQLFLGSLTKEEFRSGVISPKRLAEIKLKIGEVHAMPEFRSVAGNTSVMQLANKYTEWAVPNFQTSIGILNRMLKDAKKAKQTGGAKGFEEFLKSRAYRDAAITAMVGIGAYAVGQIVFAPEDGDKSAIGRWRGKVAREMGSIIQSATGVGVFGSSRALDMMQQLQNLAVTAITLERYETSGNGYKAGDLKFPNAAKRALVPSFVKQLIPAESSSSKPITVPKGSKSSADAALRSLNRLKPKSGNTVPGMKNLDRLKKQLGN